MASKTSGKRGSAIIVLMVAAMAGTPAAALASPGKSRGPAPATPPQAAVVVNAPAVVPQLGFGFNAGPGLQFGTGDLPSGISHGINYIGFIGPFSGGWSTPGPGLPANGGFVGTVRGGPPPVGAGAITSDRPSPARIVCAIISSPRGEG